jgi:hypothetical protein
MGAIRRRGVVDDLTSASLAERAQGLSRLIEERHSPRFFQLTHSPRASWLFDSNVRLSSPHAVYGLNCVHYQLVEILLVGDFDHDKSIAKVRICGTKILTIDYRNYTVNR